MKFRVSVKALIDMNTVIQQTSLSTEKESINEPETTCHLK